VPVTRRERDSVIARFDARGPSGFDYGRIPRTKPAILRILVDEQGRAWVRREDANRAVFFDVFASDGTLLATVELGLRRSPAFLPFVVRGNNLYTVVLDDDDVQHVVRFAISAR
jgi:hypothetical protein